MSEKKQVATGARMLGPELAEEILQAGGAR